MQKSVAAQVCIALREQSVARLWVRGIWKRASAPKISRRKRDALTSFKTGTESDLSSVGDFAAVCGFALAAADQVIQFSDKILPCALINRLVVLTAAGSSGSSISLAGVVDCQRFRRGVTPVELV